MDTRQLILNILKGSSSQNPMRFDVLLTVSGKARDELQEALEDMYQQVPAAINRVLQIKAGQEQYLYWPTGVLQSFKGDVVGARKHLTKLHGGPVRRNTEQLKTVSPAEAQKGEEMKKEEKVSNVDIVRYVISNPGVANNQVLDHFARDDQDKRKALGIVICYCLTHNYLKRQENKTLVVGDNEIWLAQHDLLPATKATTSSVATQETTAKPSPELEQFKHEKTPTADVPAFLLNTVEETKPLANLILEQSEQLVDREEKAEPSNPLPKFRISVSSDRTLTIHGKTFMPVELDADETRQLVDFLDHASRLIATV